MKNEKKQIFQGFYALPCLLLVLTSQPAMAYVGPGAGLSAIGSILAFLGVVFLIIVGFFWYPFKRMIARLSGNKNSETEGQKPK